jgi:hypothetical protein
MDISKKIKFNLLSVSDYKTNFNEEKDPECAICYKRISNKVFVCAKPCNKTFHRDCMEKMIDHIEDNTTTKPDYRCCYCRRNFDIHDYDSILFLQELFYLKNCGYQIESALIQSKFNTELLSSQTDEIFTDEFEYSVYMDCPKTYIIPRKQSNRSEFRKKNKRSHKQLHKHKGRC